MQYQPNGFHTATLPAHVEETLTKMRAVSWAIRVLENSNPSPRGERHIGVLYALLLDIEMSDQHYANHVIESDEPMHIADLYRAAHECIQLRRKIADGEGLVGEEYNRIIRHKQRLAELMNQICIDPADLYPELANGVETTHYHY